MNDHGCSPAYGRPQGPTGARLIAELIEQQLSTVSQALAWSYSSPRS